MESVWVLCTLALTLSWAKVSVTVQGAEQLHEIPDHAQYAASGTSYDDGGMGPMFDFARSFINTALPGGFPRDFINETMSAMNGKGAGLDIGDLLPKTLKRFAGYVAALVVGILFMVIFPVVGCCFGCCRLCGNCGGKRKQKMTPKLHWRRRIYAAILCVITIFMLVGNICTYVSNSRMSAAIDKIEGTVKDNLDDIDTYLTVVERQIETIGVANLNITKQEILQNMDKTTLEKNVTDYVLKQMSGGALEKMESNINTAKKAFESVTKSAKEVRATFSAVKAVCAICTDPTQTPEFADLEANKRDFDNFSSDSVVDKVKEELRVKISRNLGSLSNQQVSIGKAFTDIEKEVRVVVDRVKKFKSNADSGMDIDSYKKKVSSITEDVRKFDKYRYGAGAGLAAMTTVIVLLQLFGLAFGILGQHHNQSPTERGCISNSGGNFLTASVVFIFLFASLLMLLTTISFAVGSLLERFICQPLAPPSMELLEVADAYFPTKGILGADLPSVLRDCRVGKAAYSAFHLSSRFNLTAVDVKLHYQEKKIRDQMQLALDGLKNIGTVNFSSKANPSLTQFKESLQRINFTVIYKKLDTTKAFPKIHGPFQQHLSSLRDGLRQLETVKNQADGWSNALTDSLKSVTTGLQNQSSMKSVLESYQKTIINIAEVYVNSTKDNVENKVGKCTPLWNIYDSILLVSLCQYTIDAFNGFWFSIGWCLFFFIPAVIFAMKLSKHYHRMDAVEESGTGNKVAPAADDADGSFAA